MIAFKSILRILILAGLSSSVMSCGDFLDEKSQDLYIPKTVEDYKEFIAGEALNQGKKNGVVLAEYLDILTDDVNEKVNPRRKETADGREVSWGYYTWQEDPEVDFNNTVHADKLWDVSYHRILIANIVIDKLSEITGEQVRKDDLEAEVRFIRAWSYFMLVNTYAKPYENEEQAHNTLAVPLNTATSVQNKQLKRSTLHEIYSLIEDDLIKAVDLFSKTGLSKSIYRPNLNAALLLLSRVELYTKQYQKAIDRATQLIQNDDTELNDLSIYPSNSTIRFFDGSNKEILFTYGSKDAYRLSTLISARQTVKGCFIVDPTLLGMYISGDKRRQVFFSPSTGKVVKPFKFYEYGSKNIFSSAFHLSEAYLNRAEAYAESGQIDKAISDLNALRVKRIAGYTDVSIASKSVAIEMIRTERRLELCFEGHRWFDLRRWGCPELRHTYSSSDNASLSQEYILKQGDERYTLPIPRSERENNNNIR